jgi:hypothetical protein
MRVTRLLKVPKQPGQQLKSYSLPQLIAQVSFGDITLTITGGIGPQSGQRISPGLITMSLASAQE